EHVALGLPAPCASTYVLIAPSLPCELGERVALADALLARALGDPSAFTEPPAWRGVSIESLLT
ncbi:MAG: hypothetical protein IT378_03280, partial [Sandaracinaceae bacterium]|nr:hypothetical protein [Sandaracinaceae bacterium]